MSCSQLGSAGLRTSFLELAGLNPSRHVRVFRKKKIEQSLRVMLHYTMTSSNFCNNKKSPTSSLDMHAARANNCLLMAMWIILVT